MSQLPSSTASSMKQLISMRLGAAGFAQHWKHCDLVANYLAAFTSEILHKSDVHANLVSTVLNELLEVVFRRNAGQGEIGIVLKGDGIKVVVEISVPVAEEDRRFYEDMTKLVQRHDRDELHRQQLADPDETGEQNLSLSLLELAAVYDAVLEVQSVDDAGPLLLMLPFQIDLEHES